MAGNYPRTTRPRRVRIDTRQDTGRAAALEEIDRMSRTSFTDPEVREGLRKEYEEKIQAGSAKLGEIHLEKKQLHAEELQWAMRHLLSVEKRTVIDVEQKPTKAQ